MNWTKPVNVKTKTEVIEKVDWPQVIADLKASGTSRYRLAITLGVSEAAVKNWEKGGEPRYIFGAAILKLWMTTVKNLPVAEGANIA